MGRNLHFGRALRHYVLPSERIKLLPAGKPCVSNYPLGGPGIRADRRAVMTVTMTAVAADERGGDGGGGGDRDSDRRRVIRGIRVAPLRSAAPWRVLLCAR